MDDALFAPEAGAAYFRLLDQGCALLAVSSTDSAQLEFISIAGLERAGSDLKPGEYRLLQPFDRSKPLEIVVDLGRQLAGTVRIVLPANERWSGFVNLLR